MVVTDTLRGCALLVCHASCQSALLKHCRRQFHKDGKSENLLFWELLRQFCRRDTNTTDSSTLTDAWLESKRLGLRALLTQHSIKGGPSAKSTIQKLPVSLSPILHMHLFLRLHPSPLPSSRMTHSLSFVNKISFMIIFSNRNGQCHGSIWMNLAVNVFQRLSTESAYLTDKHSITCSLYPAA